VLHRTGRPMSKLTLATNAPHFLQTKYSRCVSVRSRSATPDRVSDRPKPLLPRTRAAASSSNHCFAPLRSHSSSPTHSTQRRCALRSKKHSTQLPLDVPKPAALESYRISSGQTLYLCTLSVLPGVDRFRFAGYLSSLSSSLFYSYLSSLCTFAHWALWTIFSHRMCACLCPLRTRATALVPVVR